MPDEQTLRLPLALSMDRLFVDADGFLVYDDQYPAIVAAVNQAPALHARIEELEAAYTALANRYAECAEKLEAAEARVEELTADLAKERLLVDVTREAAMVRQAQAERAEARVTELTKALAFARSTIKCGEPWTATCDSVIDKALALDAATQAPAADEVHYCLGPDCNCSQYGCWDRREPGGEGEHDA